MATILESEFGGFAVYVNGRYVDEFSTESEAYAYLNYLKEGKEI